MDKKLVKPKVLVTRKEIPDAALKLLYENFDVDIPDDEAVISREELLKRIAGKDALLCLLTETIDAQVLDAAGPSLKVIGTMSTGFDHLDLTAIKQRNIKVGHTPRILTDAVADLTITLLLATSRRIFEANNAIKIGEWTSWSPLWMVGPGLSQSTIGVFGLGRIGKAVVKRLKGFNVGRFLYTATAPKNEGDTLGAEYVSFETLLKESDFIIVTASLNESTKLIFNAEAFRKMKKTAIFVNVARGGLVNQDDLLHSLQNGDIRAAGLDVSTPEPLPPSHPLLFLKNCVVLPHLGSAELSTREQMATMTVQNILCAMADQPMPAQLC